MNQPRQNSFTFALKPDEQGRLLDELRNGNYAAAQVPHARAAGSRPDCKVILYESGKCLVQGKGAADWVAFVFEPLIAQRIVTGNDVDAKPEDARPHMGIDESGKGDFFGPLVIAAAYTDDQVTRRLREIGVRDSKTIRSDAQAGKMAGEIRTALAGRFALVVIGPRAYNRLYARIGNVNRLLAWGHARAIENLLEKVPACPRAVADQFGPERQIRQALLRNGREIKLEQRPRAESDPAVAAASVLARAAFLDALRALAEKYGAPIPKGASAAVVTAAEALVRKEGPAVLLETAKCHFRTTDAVLAGAGASRDELGPDGRVQSRAATARPRPVRG